MSKELRRILSLVFALALLMSLALPACAEGKISAAGSDDAFEKEYTAEGSISGVSDDPFEAEPAAREIYVSADGDDMGRGSREEPLATLSAAADLANAAEGDTVYVILLSDLTITKTARFQGKNVILMSDEGSVLVSRGSGFETAYDPLRRAYNPAMIELGSLQGETGGTSLSLDNVILDDAGLHEGSEFAAQSTDPKEEADNLERVQDAIIGVYGGARLTINPGSELRNFGGMSAVHAVGGAVTVEDNSFIHDTADVSSPAGLKAICAEGAQVRIGTEATVIERGAAPAEPVEEDADEASEENADEASEESADEASEESADEASEESAEEASEETAGEASGENDEQASEETAGEKGNAERALAGENDAAEPQDGEDDGGDEGGDSWSDLIGGLTDIIAGQIPELDRDFIETLLSGLSEDYLKDILKQLTDGGNIAEIIGDLFGGGGDIDIPGINTGSSSTLSFTAPAELIEKEDAPYKVPYKASFKLPDSLVTIINFMGTERVESGRVKLIFKLDARLDPVTGEDGKICSITGHMFEISEESYSAADHSVSVALTLADGWQEHGDELGEALDLNFTASLPDSKFAVGETLASSAKLDNFVFKVAGRSYDGSGGDAELKAETKMLPSEGARLSYDINGGEGGPDPNPVFVHEQSGYALESVSVPTHADVNGKPVVFLGWTAEKDTKIYGRADSEPETISEIDVTAGEDVTVHAVYGYDENEDGKPDVRQTLVELSFDANGGSGAPAAQSGVSDENDSVELTIASEKPTRSGYTFLGWSASRGGSASYFAGNKVKITGGNVTLYAVWQKGGSSYGPGGGSSSTAPKTGDDAPIALYAALAVISLGAVGAGAWLILRKNKKK